MTGEELLNLHHSNSGGFSRHYLTLYAMVLGMECKNVFEFGCGNSTRVIIEALRHTGGHLTSCDTREKAWAKIMQSPALYDNWDFYQGPGLEAVKALVLKEGFDLVLHDGSHEAGIVEDELEAIIPCVKRGGLILLHDTRHPSIGMQGVVPKAFKDVAHTQFTLPYGYGLTIVEMLEDFGWGEIELKWRKR
jgi:predicted O-methyltransferase YrrM